MHHIRLKNLSVKVSNKKPAIKHIVTCTDCEEFWINFCPLCKSTTGKKIDVFVSNPKPVEAKKYPERKPLFSGKLRSEAVDKTSNDYVYGSLQDLSIKVKFGTVPEKNISIEEQRRFFEKHQQEVLSPTHRQQIKKRHRAKKERKSKSSWVDVLNNYHAEQDVDF